MLILAGVIPFAERFAVLLAMAAIVLVLERVCGRSWHELGFRKDTLRDSLVANIGLSLVLSAGIVTAFAFGAFSGSTIHGFTLFYPFYVFISSPSQEFLFRSVIFAEMERAGLRGPATQVIFSTAVYTFPHAIYKDPSTLLVVAAIGLIWGFIYHRYPNWYGVALSHAVLGALSIAVGLV
ncbi:MAG TPA: CPBP family intramembrane glutamic endopeptidase [Gaiellaceae bacterium]